MNTLITTLSLCMLLLVFGCTKEIKKDGRPDWIDKPEPGFVEKGDSQVHGSISQENRESK